MGVEGVLGLLVGEVVGEGDPFLLFELGRVIVGEKALGEDGEGLLGREELARNLSRKWDSQSVEGIVVLFFVEFGGLGVSLVLICFGIG